MRGGSGAACGVGMRGLPLACSGLGIRSLRLSRGNPFVSEADRPKVVCIVRCGPTPTLSIINVVSGCLKHYSAVTKFLVARG